VLDTRNRLPDAALEDPADHVRFVGHLDKESWSRWLAHELKNRFGVPGVRELPRVLAEPDDYSVGVRSESNVHERQFRILAFSFSKRRASGQQGDRYTIGVWAVTCQRAICHDDGIDGSHKHKFARTATLWL